MKFNLIILTILIIQSSCIIYDGAWIALIGSSKIDFKNVSVFTNLNDLLGTTYFNLSKPTVLIFHGWLDRFIKDSSGLLIDDFLTRRNEFNILFGDWSIYAGDINYPSVVNILPDVSMFLEYL